MYAKATHRYYSMKWELVGMHRITDRKAMDLFPHVLYVHVLSHFIPFCINWSSVLTKLLDSKWWSKIKPFLPATQDSHMITASSLELIYLLSLFGMFYLNLEDSSAIPALNNTCSGQQSQNPQAGIVESQKHRAGRDLKRSFSPSSCPWSELPFWADTHPATGLPCRSFAASPAICPTMLPYPYLIMFSLKWNTNFPD